MSTGSSIILEIQYLPSIQYFSKLKRFEKVLIEQHEHYNKGSYRNRAHIASANGLERLSIPLVKGKNEQQPIRETKIAWYEPWAKRHWQAIHSAYGNAPFFDYYEDELRPYFMQQYTYLFDWNLELIVKIHRLLELDSKLIFTETYHREMPDGIIDFRNSIAPRAKVNVPDPYFTEIPYAQVFMEKHGFLSGLSILDLLFCTGPEAISYL